MKRIIWKILFFTGKAVINGPAAILAYEARIKKSEVETK